MLYLKLLILLLAVGSYIIGGQGHRKVRLIWFPVLIGLGVGLSLTNNIWVNIGCGLITAMGLQTIRIGYGNWSPEDDPKPSFLASLTHDRSGEYIRTIWAAIVSLGACGALIGLSYIPLAVGICYILGNVVINYSVSKFKLPVYVTDVLVSCGISSILYLV